MICTASKNRACYGTSSKTIITHGRLFRPQSYQAVHEANVQRIKTTNFLTTKEFRYKILQISRPRIASIPAKRCKQG
jgi:hypothetical protein